MSGSEGGRPVPSPSMNPMAQSHEALKAMTDAASPAGSQAVADEWAAMASGFDEAAGLFQQAMANSETGWTGDAAEGMRAQLARVAEWSKETGANYSAASAAITSQSGVSDSAKTSMPPPVPYDPAQMIKDARDSGNVFDMAALPFRMYAQKQKHDAAHEEAARIVSERDAAFTQAAGAIPEFVPPPSLNEQSTAEAAKVESEAKPPAVLPPPPRTQSHDRGHDRGPTTPASVAGPTSPASAAGFTPAPAGPAAPGGTSPAGFTPAPGGPAGAPVGPGFGAGTTAAGLGFAPGAGFGPVSSAVAGSAPALARPPVVGPGPAGPGGFGPVAPARGARGRGGQDGEQKRPEYLIEPDIEGMFGSDELTSPPVIGER